MNCKMFIFLEYFIALLAVCSCHTNIPTDPTKPANVSGIFCRYFPKDLENFVDVPLHKGLDLLKQRRFNKDTWTIFYVESWEQNANSPAPQAIVGAYLKYTPVNPVIFDWSSINTDPNYDSVAGAVEEVGTALGKQLCKLFAAGLDPNYTELIAYHLGVHVAGQAGSTTKKFCGRTFRRIVALDAATSLFYFPQAVYRPIDVEDSKQTLGIHTSGLQHGVSRRIGKADFYVNTGKQFQPGCEERGKNCNAARSWQVFVAGLGERKQFRAVKADSYTKFADQSCEENAKKEVIYLGDENIEGSFFLSTTGEPPYGKGIEGLCV